MRISTYFVFKSEHYCLGHTELIVYSKIDSFGISRDAVLHCFGADCFYESGAIAIIGNSIDKYDGVDIPKCSGFFAARAELNFYAVATPTSPTAGLVSIYKYCILYYHHK